MNALDAQKLICPFISSGDRMHTCLTISCMSWTTFAQPPIEAPPGSTNPEVEVVLDDGYCALIGDNNG